MNEKKKNLIERIKGEVEVDFIKQKKEQKLKQEEEKAKADAQVLLDATAASKDAITTSDTEKVAET